VPTIPVVTPVRIVWPVTTNANENKPAVVIRPEITISEIRPPVVTYGIAAIRPGNPVKDPVRRIMVVMIIVITSVR